MGPPDPLGFRALCRWPIDNYYIKPGTVEFTQDEKLGVIKAIDQIIRVDDRIYEGESFFISQLSKVVDFDRELFDRARKMTMADAIKALKTMPKHKKAVLAKILSEAAGADGRVDEEELKLIYRIFREAGVDSENL